ncbi:MAG TPA: sugar phosphate isomerase/epimerase family protein [bacterium]|nr:sugar phosphate isomerase/epimerase family protein [bacterium]
MAKSHDRYEVQLHCGHCRRTTAHLVVSDGGAVSRVFCIVCGRAVAVDTLQFMEQYVDSVMRRLLAKPFDISTEFRRQPREFITRLPGRVLTKPFRVAAELRATMDIVRPRRAAPREARPALPSAPGALPPVERRCQLLLSAPLMWAHEPAEILATARELGYDGVELWHYHFIEAGGDPAAIGAQARALGLLLTLHALSWDLNMTSMLEGIRTASLDALHRSIALAEQLGVATVVMHPGHATMPYDDAERYWPAMVAGVRELADHAAAHGIRLAVEHMEPRQGEYVVSPDDANRLVRDAGRDNIGTALDVAHIPWGLDEVAFIGSLERLVHVHLSDADESRLHLPLGQGARDLVRVLASLRGYAGTIACEGHSMGAGDDLARWNKGRFEELWRDAATVGAAVSAHAGEAKR